MTGKPFIIVFPDGKEIPLEDWLREHHAASAELERR